MTAQRVPMGKTLVFEPDDDPYEYSAFFTTRKPDQLAEKGSVIAYPGNEAPRVLWRFVHKLGRWTVHNLVLLKSDMDEDNHKTM